uniref:Uncharacterized protein n=1 Tax=Arundo donax TaxID=35708 RepID=A0A0A8ZHE1_ARUDO
MPRHATRKRRSCYTQFSSHPESCTIIFTLIK